MSSEQYQWQVSPEVFQLTGTTNPYLHKVAFQTRQECEVVVQFLMIVQIPGVYSEST